MAHALLSPSAASRWLNCTPSAKLELQFPDKAGEVAREGTLAHSLSELILRFKLKKITKAKYSKELAAIEADALYSPDMFKYAEDYAVFVLERYSEAQAHTKDAIIHLEQRLDMTAYVPEGFGTGDCVIIADGTMDIIDLKYGKGVMVSATANKQMMLYALGALHEFAHLYDIQQVRMTIHQPRIENYSTFEMATADLLEWAEEELKPRAELAFKGEGDFVAGDHCRFCKARAQCRALADYNLEIVKHDYNLPALLNEEEVADVLKLSDGIKSWLNTVEEFALAEALAGKKWPGFKLVEGRSNRKYIDETAVADKLLQAGFKEDNIFAPRGILGITAMEKAITKTAFNLHLSDCIIKPPGKPTLVPVEDKRPELNSADMAAADFAGVEFEN